MQMEIIKGHYTVETKEVFAIVSNPKHLSLGYDSAWNLEKWENSQWIILDKKKHTNYFAELPFLAAYYYCFSFPIEYYPITKGKYRITKSLWDKDREIKLNAMFEIN
nr:immunoglobulin-like domain-containing protein [Bacteroides cellulosilyticus]